MVLGGDHLMGAELIGRTPRVGFALLSSVAGGELVRAIFVDTDCGEAAAHRRLLTD
jgi:hypothetical protein